MIRVRFLVKVQWRVKIVILIQRSCLQLLPPCLASARSPSGKNDYQSFSNTLRPFHYPILGKAYLIPNFEFNLYFFPLVCYNELLNISCEVLL